MDSASRPVARELQLSSSNPRLARLLCRASSCQLAQRELIVSRISRGPRLIGSDRNNNALALKKEHGYGFMVARLLGSSWTELLLLRNKIGMQLALVDGPFSGYHSFSSWSDLGRFVLISCPVRGLIRTFEQPTFTTRVGGWHQGVHCHKSGRSQS